jgi:radical SAM protein with 4Fe4S-binding SPASM domain
MDVRVASVDNNWNKKRFSFNPDGAKLLELCSGVDTMKGIVEKYNASYPSSSLTMENASEFFKKAAGDGLVEMRSDKNAAAVPIRGSKEFFYPQHMSIELTSRCNYRCKHCYRGSSPDGGEDINYEKLMKFLEDFYLHGGAAVEFTGGEPMLHSRFFDIVEWAAKRFPVVGIITNGYLMDEAAQQRLLPYKNSLKFNISLDSHLPEYHNKFRGKSDAYEHSVKNMGLLGKNGFIYRAAMSITHENYLHIEDTMKLAQRMGATKFVYNLVQDIGRGDSPEIVLRQPKAMLEKYLAFERHIRANYKDFIHFVSDEAKKQAEASNCGIIQRSFVLGPDGELRPCVMFSVGMRIGNVYKQSFEEIFATGLAEAFTRIHAPKELVCGKCEHLFYCGGCILKGIKKGKELGGCPWLEKTGIMKYFKDAPEERTCSNYKESVCE